MLEHAASFDEDYLVIRPDVMNKIQVGFQGKMQLFY